MRNRLRASDRPRRLFDDVSATARAAGLLRGRRRVLDSTPLFDAVATQDTVIQLRAVIRRVLTAADRAAPGLADAVRAVLTREDDYASVGKPPCDWGDPKARDELITAVALTAANTPDRDVIDVLLDQTDAEGGGSAPDPGDGGDSGSDGGLQPEGFEVYGDSAYAGGATLKQQAARGHDMRAKVPPVRNPNGYSKDRFAMDLAAGTVTCPADHTVTIGRGTGHRSARFGALCLSCPLRAHCTKAVRGRVISIHPREAALQHARSANGIRPGSRTIEPTDPSWNARSATSPAAPGAAATPDAAATNVPPGRAGRLWLRARLDVAQRGVSLLEQKVRILDDERRRLRALTEETGRHWERASYDARTWTLRAALLGGQRSIQRATPGNPATVSVNWTTTMGIHYPDGADHSPPHPDERVVVDSSAIVFAQSAHHAALAAAARHGAPLAVMRVIDREFHATQLRAMALRRHWVPNLRAALAKIELELEEQERAEAIRVKSATAARTSSA